MSELIDNQAQRVRTLKDIIKRLHSGDAPEAVRATLRTLVRQTDYTEIMAMEQQLISEGMPVSEVQAMCDMHSQVTREVLVQVAPPPVEPGHPVDTFRRENEALREVAARMKRAMAEVQVCGEAQAEKPLLEWRQAWNELMDIDKHYQRKEHLLFSCLERHGITGPSKVMWGKDDEIRDLLKQVGRALRKRDMTLPELALVAASLGASATAAVEEMIYKEEQILLPMCLRTFTTDEWAEIWASAPRYGWCLVEPREGYRPPNSTAVSAADQQARGGVQLPTGSLSLDQLLGLFSTLPVDITFVDANDRVAFFSEGPDRVFARSRAIIGRKVQHCHPPRSVDTVERILSDFREGRQDVAEFWIDFQGRFVHIRYFAVRDAARQYLGTLEVTQDVSKIRKLSGERRLLEYEGER